MSFIYNGIKVTMDNYKVVFGDKITDIVDEVRSAVLDSTPIGEFIDACSNDSYLLGQIRLALRECVPKRYLSPFMTGRTVFLLRECSRVAIDISPVLRYIGNNVLTVESSTLEKMVECILMHGDITKMDFTIVPKNLVDVVCKGLIKKYPMHLIVEEGYRFSERYVEILMRGLSLGVDISPFQSGNWNIDSILILLSYAKTVNINTVLSHITDKYEPDYIRTICNVLEKGGDALQLCYHDNQGYPIYDKYQAYEIGEAILKDAVSDDMLKPNLRASEISEIRENNLKARDKR